MRIVRIAVALGLTLFLAGCNFQSKTLLAEPLGGGDPIVGFGTGEPVKIKILSDGNEDLANVVPQKQADGSIRYEIVAVPAPGEKPSTEPDRVYLSAKKLTDEGYVVRYTGVKPSAPSEVGMTQLAFLHAGKGEYTYLVNISDKAMLKKIFPTESARPKVEADGDEIAIDNQAQAEAISLYFDGHLQDFTEGREYGRVVIVP